MLQRKKINTDILIIGGGTAGCFAALTIAENSHRKVLIAEKANIRRSGCLAAGVNALNAYITEGHVPQDYVDYAAADANGIVRRDLLLTAAERFNHVTAKLEDMGLVILKDEKGNYAARGSRNIKINGENIKPLLAEAVEKAANVEVLNEVNITDLLVSDGRVCGAAGFSVWNEIAYDIRAEAVLIATGGAAGLYRPNTPGFSRHKMWYSPFNTGAGYAMGIRAGAEMTTFEMRFVALRCKDTIAPTGTIAQGVHARQINAKGEVYEEKYGLTTSERIFGTVQENRLGNGPCYLATSRVAAGRDEDLLRAYLNMAPGQTLKWIEDGKLPSEEDVEIEGTEAYIVGGHTASGFWVNTKRETTIRGLYAAGDVAGGCPQKYVTGALAEGEIAALDILKKYGKELACGEQPAYGEQPFCGKMSSHGEKSSHEEQSPCDGQSSCRENPPYGSQEEIDSQVQKVFSGYERILGNVKGTFSVEDLEEAMQKVMDEYAGGISAHYRFNERQLKMADEKIDKLTGLAAQLHADDMRELLSVCELQERLTVCRTLIAHLRARKETRWHVFNENLDYPDTDQEFYKYVNSRWRDGRIEIVLRDIVEEAEYEHTD